jgi:CheY-like chemotaxis protein
MQHIEIKDAKGVPAIGTASAHAYNKTDASLVETLVAENGPTEEVGSENPMHILIVDDEPEITEELAEFLENSGFSVSTATDPIDAIKMIKGNEAISVVITDLSMPNMTGLEMIEEINSTFLPERDLAVIVVTGDANTDRAVKALRLGASDFLSKPINPDILTHATRRAVESIRLKRLARDFRQLLERRVLERTEEVQKLSSILLAANNMLQIKNSELDVANQIKSEFLALINHELCTPLNAIIGFSGLMIGIVLNP